MVLIAASLSVGSASVMAQVLIPLAPRLVEPENRGRIIGALVRGLTLGILLSRTAAGLIAQVTGSWRVPFVAAAVATGILFFVLPAFMPATDRSGPRTSYLRLLASLPALMRVRPLLLSIGVQVCVYGMFSAVWSTLAFHLQGPAFGLSVGAVGLFGLWGAPGVLIAPVAGRLSAVAIAAALAMLVTWGTTHLWAIVVAINLLDFGMQSSQIANQTRIFGVGDAVRARLNTLYMAMTFTGGALGSTAAGLAWTRAGWQGVCWVCIALLSVTVMILASNALSKPRRKLAPLSES